MVVPSLAYVCTWVHVMQVHKAKLKHSGTVVAVKVQYPDSLNIMLQARFMAVPLFSPQTFAFLYLIKFICIA